LVADPSDEFEAAGPVVVGHVWSGGPGRAVGVEEVGFGATGEPLNGGTRSDVDGGEDAVFPVVVGEAGESGVDAIGGEEGVGVEIDCGDVDGASELLSLDDGSDEFVWSSEDEGGVADSAVGDEPASEGGRGGDDGLVGEGGLDGSEDVGLDASVLAEFFQELGGACSTLTEVEVVSLDDDAWVVLLDEIVEELVGFLGEELWGGFKLDDLVGSSLEEALLADLEGFDGLMGVVGAEDFHGVWMEREDDDTACLTGVGSGSLDESLVSEMDGVEVANTDGNAGGDTPVWSVSGVI
jgi:hypothetical protein